MASRKEGFSGKGLFTVGSQSSDCLLALLTVPHKNQPEGPTFSDRVSAFSLAMRSFQQNVGIYQMAERPLTFLVQILILHKAATSGFMQWDKIEDARILGSYPPSCRLHNGRCLVVCGLTAFVGRRLRLGTIVRIAG